MRWRRSLLIVGAVLVATALVVIGGVFAFRDVGAEAVRRLTVQRLEAITDREVSIAGDFDLVPSLTPTVAAEGLVVANAPWGSQPAMLDAERVVVELQLLPLLLRRDVLIDHLGLVGADVLLERGPEGQLNWEFDRTAPESAETQREFLLNEVLVEDSRVTWHDATGDRIETVTLEQLAWQADSATDDLALSGAGVFEEHPFTLAGELGSIARLLQDEEPYPIALELAVEDLEVTLEGQLGPAREAQLDVRLTGESLASVGELLERELPELGGFALEGELTGPPDELALTDLTGRIGEETGLRIEVTEGRIAHLLEGQGIQLAVQAAGPSVAALGELLGRDLPELGAYQVQGELAGALEELALSDLTGTIGEETGLVIQVRDGRITDLLDGQGMELSVQAAGPSVAALGHLVGRELPELGAYEFQGELAGALEELALRDLTGTIEAGAASSIRITGGEIANVIAGEGVRVPLAAAGEELAELAQALGIEMAPFGPYEFEGTLVGSFDNLALQNARASAGDQAARIELAGAIDNALALSGLDLAVTIEGQDLAALAPIARVDLPSSDPYRIAGHLSGSATDLSIEDLEVELADSTFGGWLAVRRAEDETPRVEGEIVADRLDLDRVLALADRAADEQAETEEPVPEQPVPGEARVFPAAPLPLDALDRMEADLALRADEVMLDATAFTDASLNLTLLDGRLGLDDLVLQVKGGRVAGDLAVEAEAGVAEVMVRLSAGNIDVGRLLSDLGATEQVVGEVDIDINIDSTGRSIEELMAELDGSAAVAAEEGRLEDNQLDRLVADLDILRALPFWQREDAVHVNCLIGEFDIEDGVAETGAMLDTQRMTLLGEGTVDLGEETFDLLLRPLPKTQKLSTLAVPVEIEGTFAEPAVRPRTGTAVAQAARGVLGGLLIPLNQISALFGQETVDACVDALEQARERRENPAPEETQSPT